MKLAYVGDGPRDEQMVPALVTQWIGPHERTFEAWHDIRLHTGWARKLKYAAVRATRDGLAGLVATLDRDAAAPRLPDLVAVRDELRARGDTLPMALGEAVPHGEAWLVDDLEPSARWRSWVCWRQRSTSTDVDTPAKRDFAHSAKT